MNNFLNEYETNISNEFIKNGYIIRPTNDKIALNFLQNHFVKNSSDILNKKVDVSNDDWLNGVSHSTIPCQVHYSIHALW